MHSLCSLRSPQRSLARASLQSPRLLCSVRSHASPCHTPAARFACLGPCLPARVAHRHRLACCSRHLRSCLACCLRLLLALCCLPAAVASLRHLLACSSLRSRLACSSLPLAASRLAAALAPLAASPAAARFARRASPAAARFARRSPARAAPPRSLCCLLQHF